MPGHKLGRGIPDEFRREIEKLDLTEIPGLDNLHAPTGVIQEAQRFAAEAFGAKRSFFLVNGCTVGLHAAIAAMCRPGQRLIVGRDCHRAVINGMLLAGVKPYYILPEYSEKFSINTGITAEAVEKAIEAAPDAAGVFITRPNYYGICSDVGEIAKIAHKHGKLLAVDEAHGSHLVFSSRLPVCALEAGADICIQSAHKTLPAFTQGAYLHIGSDSVDAERLQYFLSIFQTTSPSYIIMAYLDIAREIMQQQGKVLLDKLLDTIEACSGELEQKDIKLMNGNDFAGFDYDKTRITIHTATLGMTGYDAERILRETYNIQIEMSDRSNIVCISTVSDDSESMIRLFSAFKNLKRHARNEKPSTIPVFQGLRLPEQMAEPSKILNAVPERVLLKHAPGRVSREIISPYPPGIAVVCPGEVFSNEAAELLREIIRCGGIVHGIDENGTVVVI